MINRMDNFRYKGSFCILAFLEDSANNNSFISEPYVFLVPFHIFHKQVNLRYIVQVTSIFLFRFENCRHLVTEESKVTDKIDTCFPYQLLVQTWNIHARRLVPLVTGKVTVPQDDAKLFFHTLSMVQHDTVTVPDVCSVHPSLARLV